MITCEHYRISYHGLKVVCENRLFLEFIAVGAVAKFVCELGLSDIPSSRIRRMMLLIGLFWGSWLSWESSGTDGSRHSGQSWFDPYVPSLLQFLRQPKQKLWWQLNNRASLNSSRQILHIRLLVTFSKAMFLAIDDQLKTSLFYKQLKLSVIYHTNTWSLSITEISMMTVIPLALAPSQSICIVHVATR